jgi:hypothetical protein
MFFVEPGIAGLGMNRSALAHWHSHWSEWFEFVVEVAKTSLDLSAKQGTLASPTTKVSESLQEKDHSTKRVHPYRLRQNSR